MTRRNVAMRPTRPSRPIILLRLLRFLLHLGYGSGLALLYPALRRSHKAQVLQGWSRKLLSILKVQMEAHGDFTSTDGMLVANHVSWLDVLALNAAMPCSFVAKSELRAWPLLGWLSRRVSTLFIDRSDSRDAVRINRLIAARLHLGENVAFFPEGTTTASQLPGHFHSSLLQSAIDSQADIHPIAIRYHDQCGYPTHDADFVGDTSFVRSLWRILSSASLHVTLNKLPALATAGKQRRHLAKVAHAAISKALPNPLPSLSPRYDNAPTESAQRLETRQVCIDAARHHESLAAENQTSHRIHLPLT
jgi:1-acyl-sn-glycerol-3-phosphate acyltransferase